MTKANKLVNAINNFNPSATLSDFKKAIDSLLKSDDDALNMVICLRDELNSVDPNKIKWTQLANELIDDSMGWDSK